MTAHRPIPPARTPAVIPERLRTARLVARRPRPADAPELAPVLAEPGVGAWLWPGSLGGPRTAEQTAALVRADVEQWERAGWGPWILRDRAGGEVLGRAGLCPNVIDGTPAIEVAWLLTERRWGEGLATEIARVAIRAGLYDLGLAEIVAIARTDNPASLAVMRKLGMTFVREIDHAGLSHVLARLGAQDDASTARRPSSVSE